MFSLMDRVERGIDEMLRYLEEHIKHQGLADMIVSATIITTVCYLNCIISLLGRLPKVDNNIEGRNVRPSVRTSTKSFFNLNEIWYIGRGR